MAATDGEPDRMTGTGTSAVAAAVSIDMCLSGRDLTEPQLSPDGETVAFVVRWGASAAIALVSAAGGPERLVTMEPQPSPGRGLGGGCFDWHPDGHTIAYAARDGHIWTQRLDGAQPVCVTDSVGGEAPWWQSPVWAPDGSAIVAILDQAQAWWLPVPGAGGVSVVEPASAVDRAFDTDGTHAVDGADGVEWADGAVGSASDAALPKRLDDGRAEFCLDPFVTPCGSAVLWTSWSPPDMPWDGAIVVRHVFETGGVDTFVGPTSVHQPRTLPDGRGLCVRDDSGWLNVWVDEAPLVDEALEHAGPTWGPGQRSFAASPDGRFVAFTRNEGGFGSLCVATVPSAADDAAECADGPAQQATEAVQLGRGVHGQISWRGGRIAALRTGARTPTQIVVYDAGSNTTTPGAIGDIERWTRRVLAVGPVHAWEHVDLPEPELVEATAADGATIHARRYVAGTGRALCWIHGGPTDQWQVDFNARIAYWWSRGWDIIVPDPRGTTGHGRAYQQALRGRWGELDVDDTAAVLQVAYAAGWSSPATTVMMGGSSGGLTVLGVLGRHPGLTAGGVALYPVTDIAVLAEKSHRYERHYTDTLVMPMHPDGSHVPRFEELSPLSRCEAIDVPLLVMHGDSDPVVPLDGTLTLVDRMRAAGREVELIVFEGEGHGFRDPANKRAEYGAVAAFLDRTVVLPSSDH